MSLPLSSAAAKRIMVAGVVLPLALLASATHAQEESQWESGEQVYESVCGHCHAPEVGVGPVLAGRGLPEVYLRAIVRNGFNAMPAFPASHIDDESIAKVAEYLSSLPAPADQP